MAQAHLAHQQISHAFGRVGGALVRPQLRDREVVLFPPPNRHLVDCLLPDHYKLSTGYGDDTHSLHHRTLDRPSNAQLAIPAPRRLRLRQPTGLFSNPSLHSDAHSFHYGFEMES